MCHKLVTRLSVMFSSLKLKSLGALKLLYTNFKPVQHGPSDRRTSSIVAPTLCWAKTTLLKSGAGAGLSQPNKVCDGILKKWTESAFGNSNAFKS